MALDFFGNIADDVRHKKLWLLDMDGTIYNEDTLFPGTIPFLEAIRAQGGRYMFITNNSSRSVVDYVKKMDRLGIPTCEDDFFTSAQATVLWLKQNHPGAKVYCQGTRSLVNELVVNGINVTEEVEPVDVVLVGFDLELTTRKLRNTCEILSTQDPVYIAANPDWVCPVSFGFIPDCGSICQMLKNATGKWPSFIGKPEPLMINYVIQQLGYTPYQTVVVGDRLYTDIESGLRAGVMSICVLSGEATVADIRTGSIKPTLTFKSVTEICEALMA